MVMHGTTGLVQLVTNHWSTRPCNSIDYGLGGGFNDVFMFTPILGEIIHLSIHNIFQAG